MATGNRATWTDNSSSHWSIVLAVLTFTELAGALETSLLYSAVPAALREFPSALGISWLTSSYFLSAAVAAAICGRLGDLFGRQQVLRFVLAIATVGSLLSLSAKSLPLIIAGRAIQGISGAILPLCYGLVRDTLPRPRLALGIGIITAAGSFGAAAGFIVGGVIVDSVGWRQIFSCSGSIAAVALILCHFFLARSPTAGRSSKLDVAGALLIALTLCLLLWAISNAAARDVSAGRLITLAAAGLAALGIWIRHELRHPDPLINVRLMADPEIAKANMAVAFSALGAVQILQIFPLLLQQPAWTGIGFGLSATMAGIMKLPSNLASVFGSTVGGGLSDRYGNRSIIIAGALLTAVSWAALLAAPGKLPATIALFCLSSTGATMLVTGAIATVVDRVPGHRTSEATSITIVWRTICQGIGSQIVITLLLADTVHAKRSRQIFPAPSSYDHALIYVLTTCLGAVFVSLLLSRRQSHKTFGE